MANNSKELADVHVSFNRLLHYKVDPELSKVGIKNPITIPFGSIRSPEKHKFFVKYSSKGLSALYAVSDDEPDEELQILPGYKWTGKIRTENYGEVDVEIRELIHDVERRRAMQLVMRSHYLNPPLRGLFIGCWLTNPAQIEKIRKGERDKQKKVFPDSAWLEPIQREGQMVGCAVLDVLYQGLPNGRKKIIQNMGLKNVLDESNRWIKKKGVKLRTKIVNLLGIAWASRFVVDEPYQGLRLGTLLAIKLVEVAHSHRVPRAKFIEVITTENVEIAKERIKKEKSGFLGKAGYILDQDEMPSRRRMIPDENGDQIQPESVRKLYYYIETTSHEK